MLFLVRSYRRFPLQWSVTIRVGPFQGQGQDIVWNLPVPAFDFLAIWPCDEEKIVHLRSHSQLSNASRFLKQWGDGRSGGSCDGEFSNRAAHPRSTSALFETIGVRT
jgi:hypothetical protein